MLLMEREIVHNFGLYKQKSYMQGTRRDYSPIFVVSNA